MSSTSKSYKYCLVPTCSNTTANTPGKIFLHLPPETNTRLAWLEAMNINSQQISGKSNHYVCEDHFDLETDMENYLMWKTVGGRKRIRTNVVPHKLLHRSQKRPVEHETEELVKKTKHDSYTPIRTTSEIFRVNHKTVGVQTVQIQTRTIGTSPIKKSAKDSEDNQDVDDSITSESSSTKSNVSQYVPSSTSSSCAVVEKPVEEVILPSIEQRIFNNPARYIGLNKDSIHVITTIMQLGNISRRDILVTLMKIRTGRTFGELADDFNISETKASRIFRQCLPPMTAMLKDLIIKPTVDQTCLLVPIPFRARYCNVSCIIDCLESEIQKPSDAVKQALTWSDYKKANTMKYLVASTPDGIITYVSKGFGGRATDTTVVEESDFIQQLHPNSIVMADRGFKSVETLLHRSNCTLIRPPTVNAEEKMKKEDVLLTKKIASMRIHIERVIRRIREFKLLKPHSCVPVKLVPLLDSAVIVACALVNLQGPIVR